MEEILWEIRSMGPDRGPEIIQRLEGLATPQEYDTLLFDICHERQLSPSDIDQIDRANTYVTGIMQGHMRKDKVTPTSVHLKRVAIIVAALGGDVFNIQHALLHDILEDTKPGDKSWSIENHPVISVEDLQRDFGDQMAMAVSSVSKAKSRYLRVIDTDEQAMVLSRFELSPMEASTVQRKDMWKVKAPTGKRRIIGKNAEKKEIIEANLPIQTHYRLFEALDNYRVVITKLADRLDYFLTLNEFIKPQSARRKAFETLELYVPLANRLRMHWLREELAHRAFAIYARKKAAILERNTNAIYPRNVLDMIEQDVSDVFENSSGRKPEVYAFTPSWWQAFKEYGSTLEDADALTAIPPLVNIALPFSVQRNDLRPWFAKIRPWWELVNKQFGLPPGSWTRFKQIVSEGEMGDFYTEIRGRPVIVRFGSYEQYEKDLAPIIRPNGQEVPDNMAAKEFAMLHENFMQLHEVWPANVATGSNHNLGKIVDEIMRHLHRPLVRIYGNDGKPAILPKGATLFDAACYFGSDVARMARVIRVKRADATYPMPLSVKLKDEDKVTMDKLETQDNFMPAMLAHATTHLAKEMLREALLRKVANERGVSSAKDRVITNELVGRGVGVVKALYDRRLAFTTSSRRLPRHIRSMFTKKENMKLQRLLKDINHPSYESFMIAVALNRLTSKRKQRLLREIVDHLITLRNPKN